MVEVNIDTISGPTHYFGGLAFGNVASTSHQGKASHPKKAALQGLKKMQLLHTLGIPQLILPPHPRPALEWLLKTGFHGTEQEMIEQCYEKEKELLLLLNSSSFMWTANSATVTPSSDSQDKKVHFTAANLSSNFHRAIEAPLTSKLLSQLFPDPRFFVHHAPLTSSAEFADEGAANHTRFSNGLHLFVYGKSISSKQKPKNYPARESKEAQTAIARLHRLPENKTAFVQQNPEAIDTGVFHTDVIATGFENFLLYHEKAFLETSSSLQKKLPGITCIEITEQELSLQDAIRSYFFNSQIVRSDKLILIAPAECEHLPLMKSPKLSFFDEIRYVDLKESMMNGGGPACLRLRVQLTLEELSHVHRGAVFSPSLFTELTRVIERYYPDTFTLEDILNPQFREQCFTATSQIWQLLQLEI